MTDYFRLIPRQPYSRTMLYAYRRFWKEYRWLLLTLARVTQERIGLLGRWLRL